MFCGNYTAAKEDISDALLRGIKRGWEGNHQACWQWTSSSEISLLNKIREKSLIVAEQILLGFIEIPVPYCGWVPQRNRSPFPHVKILALMLAELEFFWPTAPRSKYQERRIKSIQKELRSELKRLDFIWENDGNEKKSIEDREPLRRNTIAKRELKLAKRHARL
jgi:hypothetical protein